MPRYHGGREKDPFPGVIPEPRHTGWPRVFCWMGVHVDLGNWGIQVAGNTAFVYVNVHLGWEWVKTEVSSFLEQNEVSARNVTIS